MKCLIFSALLLAGCEDPKLTFAEVDAISRSCLDAGTVPRILYYAFSNDIASVTCEPK